MIEVVGFRYCRLGTADLEKTVKFAEDMIGLEVVGRENGCVYTRGDDRDHNICYFQGDPTNHTLGLELAGFDELDAAESNLSAAGLEVNRGSDAEAAARRCMGYINFRDPSGNSIDLTVRPFAAGHRYFPGRDAGIDEFSHIGLAVTNPREAEKFWSEMFNFRTSDWIGWSALMTFDAVHHRFALFPSDKPGIQHINFQVRETDDVMRSNYFLRDHQVRIQAGPGRHSLSGARFLYFYGPDNMIYEYSCGVRMVDDSWRARQFPVNDASFCAWGSKPDLSVLEDTDTAE
ncbi:MAG: glyoxalase/bleomycin resistance/extradiol dioxygenase family protein [Alphaproteobacteria bacterium]|nr:glyoxalase/bleomycin resistance/extradiol dioxygenase family protein [Alphaproteobacteria bacterium]HCO99916.1 glyoxalase/bleomycin resistance/extradiol dioxygenase family protein [Rhodospirillaceae bacterium]